MRRWYTGLTRPASFWAYLRTPGISGQNLSDTRHNFAPSSPPRDWGAAVHPDLQQGNLSHRSVCPRWHLVPSIGCSSVAPRRDAKHSVRDFRDHHSRPWLRARGAGGRACRAGAQSRHPRRARCVLPSAEREEFGLGRVSCREDGVTRTRVVARWMRGSDEPCYLATDSEKSLKKLSEAYAHRPGVLVRPTEVRRLPAPGWKRRRASAISRATGTAPRFDT